MQLELDLISSDIISVVHSTESNRCLITLKSPGSYIGLSDRAVEVLFEEFRRVIKGKELLGEKNGEE